MKALRTLFVLLAAVAAGAASGALRGFPPAAKKAMLYPDAQAPRSVRIGQETLPLAPGAQIRDARNLIVMPNTLREPVPVRYVLDAAGRVSRIWMLTVEEQSTGGD
ncbi:MAG: hypothetical protein OHK0026_07110 [Rhodocyclaceae bacterium]